MSTSKEAKEAKEEEQAAHYALIEQLDIHSIHKTFRNPSWRPNQRRNKNIKAILGESQRKEASASMAATPLDNGSGAATPSNNNNNSLVPGERDNDKDDDGLSTSGASTPATTTNNNNNNNNNNTTTTTTTTAPPNLAQASRSLSKLVLEKTLRPGGAVGAPSATYTNIESAPSMAPQKRYCDVTGLPAPYQDPKTRLRYHDKEVFSLIRGLPQGYAEQYLEARGAHTVLK